MHEEIVDMNGKSINVLHAQMKGVTRIYANFLYGGSIVIVCCTPEMIDYGFLNEFSLGTLDLN